MIERDIKVFILRALLAASPMPDDSLKQSIRSAFPSVAFPDGDLKRFIRELEDGKNIAGTNDEIFGPVWALTPKGKIKAQQL